MVMSLSPAMRPCSSSFSDACGAACYPDEASPLQNTYPHTFCCEYSRRLLVCYSWHTCSDHHFCYYHHHHDEYHCFCCVIIIVIILQITGVGVKQWVSGVWELGWGAGQERRGSDHGGGSKHASRPLQCCHHGGPLCGCCDHHDGWKHTPHKHRVGRVGQSNRESCFACFTTCWLAWPGVWLYACLLEGLNLSVLWSSVHSAPWAVAIPDFALCLLSPEAVTTWLACLLHGHCAVLSTTNIWCTWLHPAFLKGMAWAVSKYIFMAYSWLRVSDPANTHTFPSCSITWSVWLFCLQSPEYYEYMKDYSPVDNIQRAEYPNIMVTAGLHDPRVGYWWVSPAQFALVACHCKWVSKSFSSSSSSFFCYEQKIAKSR